MENNSEIEIVEGVKINPPAISIEKDAIYKMLTTRKEKLLPLLKYSTSRLEKLARSFTFCIYENGFNELNAHSIMNSFIKCCEFDLDPASGLGKIYLVKFKNKLDVIVGHQGWLELLWRSPLVTNVYSNCIYEGDEYEQINGNVSSYRHIPKFPSSGILIATYAVVNLKEGQIQIRRTDLDEINKSKKENKGSDSPTSPWNKYFNSMARLVPLRKIGKSLALSIRKNDEHAGDNSIRNLTLAVRQDDEFISENEGDNSLSSDENIIE